MNIAEARSGLQSELDSRFAPYGFMLRKRDFEYVRTVGDIRFIFRLEVHTMTGWFLVTPAVFVGCATINRTFNDILKRNIQVTGSTFGFSVRNERNQQRGHYSMNVEEDILAVAEALWLDYTEIASPFFETVNSIAGIDKCMNTPKVASSPGRSVSGACLGLIAAKLAGNPRLLEIADTYYAFWSKAQSPIIAADIVTVKKALTTQQA